MRARRNLLDRARARPDPRARRSLVERVPPRPTPSAKDVLPDSLSASEIEEQDKAISANAAAISEALKSNAKLKDTEAKTTYAKGLLVLAQGVKKYVGMNKDVGGMSSSLSSASPMQLMNLQPSVYVVKNLPASITNVSDALRNAINFAQSNGVEIPKDVASVQSLI